MKQNADRLIQNLTPAIAQKCAQLQAARREKLQARLFAVLCVLTATIPALLVLAGVSLTVLLVPVLFMSLGVVLLLPVLLSGRAGEEGGERYEQA